MLSQPKRQGTNFSFSAWLKFTGWLFFFTILVTVIWNYFDANRRVKEAFEANQLIRRLVISMITALVVTIWRKPPPAEKEEQPPVQR